MTAVRNTIVGLVAAAAGLGVFLVQMFVGLNDDDEYSNPWYLQAAHWVAVVLVVGGLLASAVGLALRASANGKRAS